MSGFGFGTQTKMHQVNNIDIFYQNVRGLRTKLDEFRNSIESLHSDLYAITESGYNCSIEDSEIIPPGFQILRCDRTDGRKQGGAFLVATHRFELRQVHVTDVTIDTCVFEMVCATVYLNNRFLFLCSVI